jgi:hypothetical protein
MKTKLVGYEPCTTTMYMAYNDEMNIKQAEISNFKHLMNYLVVYSGRKKPRENLRLYSRS